MAFSPDGRFLAAGDIGTSGQPTPPDGHVAVWRAATGSLVRAPFDLRSGGDSVAFSRDGQLLAVGLDQGPVDVLRAASGQLVRTLRPVGTADQLSTNAVAFAPDGTLATGNWSGVVQLWNPTTARERPGPDLQTATTRFASA